MKKHRETKDCRFYVIYSFDCCHARSIKSLQPPNVKAWNNTEGDEQYELNYLGGDWEKGKHRKYCRDMTYEQFKKFIDHTCLTASPVETMGSLTGMGILPAISFDGDDYDSIANAYVTPYVEGETLHDEDWDSLKEQIVKEFN